MLVNFPPLEDFQPRLNSGTVLWSTFLANVQRMNFILNSWYQKRENSVSQFRPCSELPESTEFLDSIEHLKVLMNDYELSISGAREFGPWRSISTWSVISMAQIETLDVRFTIQVLCVLSHGIYSIHEVYRVLSTSFLLFSWTSYFSLSNIPSHNGHFAFWTGHKLGFGHVYKAIVAPVFRFVFYK